MRNFVGVVVSAALFTILLACGAGEVGQRIVDVDSSRRAARAADLLQDVLHAISAYPYDTVAGLCDPTATAAALPSDPDFRIDLGVINVRDGLLRIEATVVEKPSQQRVGQFVTYRSQS